MPKYTISTPVGDIYYHSDNMPPSAWDMQQMELLAKEFIKAKDPAMAAAYQAAEKGGTPPIELPPSPMEQAIAAQQELLAAATAPSGPSWFTQKGLFGLPNWVPLAGGAIVLVLVLKKRRKR